MDEPRPAHGAKRDRDHAEPTAAGIIALRLEELDWSYADLARRMRTIDHTAAEPASLIPMISKWLHGTVTPGRHNRRLLAQALGLETAVLRPGTHRDRSGA